MWLKSWLSEHVGDIVFVVYLVFDFWITNRYATNVTIENKEILSPSEKEDHHDHHDHVA